MSLPLQMGAANPSDDLARFQRLMQASSHDPEVIAKVFNECNGDAKLATEKLTTSHNSNVYDITSSPEPKVQVRKLIPHGNRMPTVTRGCHY